MMPDSFDATKLENAAIGHPSSLASSDIVDLDNNPVNTNVVARPHGEDALPKSRAISDQPSAEQILYRRGDAQ